MDRIFEQSFYQRDDILQIAQDLLGSLITTRINKRECSAMIVETEAYKAPDDKGSHAYGNRRTKRTEVMFGEGGRAYVYLCYGLHQMFNVVSGPMGLAHAILVRAAEPVDGIAAMQERRNIGDQNQLTNGPGKLCQAMGITREHNGSILFDKSSDITISEFKLVQGEEIISGPRVGIAYAEECAHLPWRFRVKNNRWTSKPDQVNYPK